MLISNKQRKEFSTNPKYFEEVGGDRMKIKVIKPTEVGEEMKRERLEKGQSMVIELRAIFPPKKKEFKHKVNFAKDREFGGLYYGIYTGMDRFKNPSWYRLLFDKEQEVFNLKDSEDLKKFPVIAMHPYIQGTPYAHMSEPVFTVYDPKEESVSNLVRLGLIPKVTEFINSLKGKDLAQFARYSGVPITTDMDEVMIKGRLAELGIRDPKSFIDKVNTKNRRFEELYTTALDVGVLVDDVEKGYLFNGLYIGSSREEVIDKMKHEGNLVNGMMLKVEEYDMISLDLETESEKHSVVKKEKVEEAVSTKENRPEFDLSDLNLNITE